MKEESELLTGHGSSSCSENESSANVFDAYSLCQFVFLTLPSTFLESFSSNHFQKNAHLDQILRRAASSNVSSQRLQLRSRRCRIALAGEAASKANLRVWIGDAYKHCIPAFICAMAHISITDQISTGAQK